MNFKKIIKKIINIFGYEIKKKDLEIEELSFDQILKKKLIKKKPIIFDVGANNGQSIDRFLNLFLNYLCYYRTLDLLRQLPVIL